MSRRNRRDDLRRLIAVEAAKLISEQGIRDYHQAKLKAAHQLNAHGGDTPLPRNDEVEAALREHQSLFTAHQQPQILDRLRQQAVHAMTYFQRFQPRLVGPVLEGTADRHSAVCLHVFCDPLEEFRLFLDDNHIPYDQQQRTLKLNRQRSEVYQAFLFLAGETPMDVTALPLLSLRQAPLSPIDGKPMKRANISRLQQLIDQEENERKLMATLGR